MIEILGLPIFNHSRKIRVYLPQNYQKSNKAYPVLYMHDGQNVFGNEEAIGGVSLELDTYLDENEIELIVVAIDQNTEGLERFNEYCSWKNGEFSKTLLGPLPDTGGKGEEYVDFIVNDLKPLIDSTYRSNREQSYIAGISLGAHISLYAASKFPHVFRRVAGVSSAFYRNQEEMEAFLQASDLSALEQVYMDCGTTEMKDNPRVSDLFLQSNKRIYEILTSKGVAVEFNVIDEGVHRYEDFKKRWATIIKFLLA